MADRHRRQIWASEEFVGLMDRIRRELNLRISDPECTKYITNNYLNFTKKKGGPQ